ncbi:MAG: type II toxin-antitoxin system HicB family antitoxin [Ardenticatenaceae bacterium]|nr:type II toxin-antitoxin system HicB family antitoxin [Ardenticatenaceae bacterium]
MNVPFRLAVEDIEPGHWVGYVLDLPGCFSSGASLENVFSRAPQAIKRHFGWLATHEVGLEIDLLSVETSVAEQFASYTHPDEDDPDYIINAFFEDDRRPLGVWDVENALRLMTWTRNDLLALQSDVQRAAPLGKDTIAAASDILRHIANAENWYLSRLDVGLDQEQLPDDPWELLATVRSNAQAQLVQLIADNRILEKSGETWSARKIVRRLLWHEQDHTSQLLQILEQST